MQAWEGVTVPTLAVAHESQSRYSVQCPAEKGQTLEN